VTERARVLIVGEGIAGLATALDLCERGVPVTLIARQSAPACESSARHDGLDAALGEEDSPERHADDLVQLGADRDAVEAMCERAPDILRRLERMGIPLERTTKDVLRLEKLPGASVARTAHAGDVTARHVARRLLQRLLGFEARGVLQREVGWQVLDLVRDDASRVVGCVARHFASGEIAGFPAARVCLASGGHLGLFWSGGHAPPALGAATAVAFRHGADVVGVRRTRSVELAYAAGGFTRLLPERLLAQDVRPESGLLDLGDLDRARVRRAASTALEAHATATRLDAYAEAVPVRTAPARTLGGLWVSAEHATTLDGLFAVGGACARYFGEETTSGTPLTAALFGAERAAEALAGVADEPSTEALELAEERAREQVEVLLEAHAEDAPSPFQLRRELVEIVLAGGELDDFASKLDEARAGDPEPRANAGLELLLELRSVLPLARAAVAERDHSGPPRWRWQDGRVEAVS